MNEQNEKKIQELKRAAALALRAAALAALEDKWEEVGVKVREVATSLVTLAEADLEIGKELGSEPAPTVEKESPVKKVKARPAKKMKVRPSGHLVIATKHDVSMTYTIAGKPVADPRSLAVANRQKLDGKGKWPIEKVTAPSRSFVGPAEKAWVRLVMGIDPSARGGWRFKGQWVNFGRSVYVQSGSPLIVFRKRTGKDPEVAVFVHLPGKWHFYHVFTYRGLDWASPASEWIEHYLKSLNWKVAP